MRSSKSKSAGPPLWIVGLVVLVLAAGGMGWLLVGDEEPASMQQEPTAATETQDETPAQLPDVGAHAQPAVRAEPAPLPDTTPRPKPASQILATNVGPSGCIEGIAVDAAGTPVAGVLVGVYQGNALLSGAFPGSRLLLDVQGKTGADGSFRLCEIPVGDAYVVVGEHADFARSETTNLRVDQDKTVAGVTLRMEAGAVVRGTVTTAGGGPLAQARVELHDMLQSALLTGRPQDAEPWKVTFTDAAGRYAFAHVSATTMRVRASADNYETQTQTSSQGLDFTAKDLQMDFELAPGRALPGRVVDEYGSGIAGAYIEVNSLGKEPQSTASAESDASGWFRLDGLGMVPYSLRATCTGFSDTTMPKVHVTAGQIQVTMEPRGLVEGVAVNAGGEPVRSYTLFLMRSRANAEPHYLNNSRQIEDPRGFFRFDDLDPGDYVLEARADGYADSRSEVFTVARGDTPSAQLRILMLKGGTLRGTVYDSRGQGVAGALVSLNPNNHIDSSISRIFKQIAPTDEREVMVRSGAGGEYVIEHIPAGTYQLSAEHRDHAPCVINDIVVIDDSQGANRTVDLPLPPGAVIAGQALDSTGPLAFCKVQINRPQGGYMNAGTTDKDGYFTFGNLASGDYTVTVTPERVDGEPVHPFIRLVYAKKSQKEVFVNEGQVLDGLMIRLTKQ
jgi:protocatechuate 3,4-dioxygenase beta subunit